LEKAKEKICLSADEAKNRAIFKEKIFEKNWDLLEDDMNTTYQRQ
jgi:hypothetical protein